MAGTVPTYPQLRISRIAQGSPIEWALSQNGSQIGVDLGDKRRTRWQIVYRITQVEFDALVSLYESNQSVSGSGNGSVSFTDQRTDDAYNVQFLDRPTSRWIGGPRRPLEATVNLIEIS